MLDEANTIDAPSPIKVLVVDDLDDNLLALGALLRKPGLEVLTARSGREALELLLHHEMALALVDVQMPEMDGFELAELMRGAERTRTVPIIFITAGSREQNRIFRGYDAGAVDFLFKPVDAHVLRHKVDTFVQLHLQKQQLTRQLELLRESEQLRARILESSHDAIAVLDAGGNILGVKASVTTPLSPEETEKLIGVDWTSLWHRDDRSAAIQAIRAARAGGVGRYVGRANHPAAIGRWWDVAITPILDASGRVEKLVAVSRDVTEQRDAQAERERLTTELRETLRLNETFVAAITHDLRNPLGAILTTAEMMLRRTGDPAMRRPIERMVSSGKRMDAMIATLFDLARARLGGGIPVERSRTDLLPLARKVVAEQQATSPDRQIELGYEGELSGCWDGDRIEQLLSNLLSNAIGHGRAEGTVSVMLDGKDAGAITLCVRNAGTIDAELLPHIFDPFRRGHGKSDRPKGLGLGLYIVQQIVKGHGGTIDVDSTPAAGTCFRVSLPRGETRAIESAASA
jgi:PAS domain S-box-containing protein